jgi:hypothetical protein
VSAPACLFSLHESILYLITVYDAARSCCGELPWCRELAVRMMHDERLSGVLSTEFIPVQCTLGGVKDSRCAARSLSNGA